MAAHEQGHGDGSRGNRSLLTTSRSIYAIRCRTCIARLVEYLRIILRSPFMAFLDTDHALQGTQRPLTGAQLLKTAQYALSDSLLANHPSRQARF